MICSSPNSTVVCSNHGDCVCGVCECFPTAQDSARRYSGQFCQCNDYSCDYYERQLCGGKCCLFFNTSYRSYIISCSFSLNAPVSQNLRTCLMLRRSEIDSCQLVNRNSTNKNELINLRYHHHHHHIIIIIIIIIIISVVIVVVVISFTHKLITLYKYLTTHRTHITDTCVIIL